MKRGEPDQYTDRSIEQLTRDAIHLVTNAKQGVLTLASGGCARYAFSTQASYCLDRSGYPLICYHSSNPHHHLIMTNSSVELRLIHRLDTDGNEEELLLVIGMLNLVDPGDHNSLDRHLHVFSQPIENYARGQSRLYRLIPDRIFFEHISGKRTAIPVTAIVRPPIQSQDAPQPTSATSTTS